jgi:hypothetical protein
MEKKVLSEQALYHGTISMPKGFEIEEKNLTSDILQSKLYPNTVPFSKTLDKLSTYISDHIKVKHNITLIQKETYGDAYTKEEITLPILDIDPVNLRNSPDFTLLYGVKVKNCHIRVYYDDNRRKGRSWDIELKNNMFVMFPSSNMYNIINKQKDSLNFIQTILYEYI